MQQMIQGETKERDFPSQPETGTPAGKPGRLAKLGTYLSGARLRFDPPRRPAGRRRFHW
jgi:hypothetical protein